MRKAPRRKGPLGRRAGGKGRRQGRGRPRRRERGLDGVEERFGSAEDGGVERAFEGAALDRARDAGRGGAGPGAAARRRGPKVHLQRPVGPAHEAQKLGAGRAPTARDASAVGDGVAKRSPPPTAPLLLAPHGAAQASSAAAGAAPALALSSS